MGNKKEPEVNQETCTAKKTGSENKVCTRPKGHGNISDVRKIVLSAGLSCKRKPVGIFLFIYFGKWYQAPTRRAI